jgi:integrase
MLAKWSKRYEALDLPNDANPRQGLDEVALKRLREVIQPEHGDNPWEPDVRFRNGLMVLMLWSLGIRHGELLALETRDVTFAPDRAFIRIVRRPDNPADPRSPRPAVKTLCREIVLETQLANLLRSYIMGQRREHPAARRHPFVFVSSANGAPLTPSSLNKVFQALRRRVQDLPNELSPHVMRHSWNDAFSAASDRANPNQTEVEKTQEQRMRSYLMGWKPDSQMAGRYSRRWTRDAANERLLSLQKAQKIVSSDPPQKGD